MKETSDKGILKGFPYKQRE